MIKKNEISYINPKHRKKYVNYDSCTYFNNNAKTNINSQEGNITASPAEKDQKNIFANLRDLESELKQFHLSI